MHILVVDDDEDARTLMQAALHKAGFRTTLATSGREALRLWKDGPVDLVMLDVDMPGMDGFEVCRRLRTDAGPLLPVVMVTGMDDLESVELAYHGGATDFIAKPVNWALLGHRLRYLLRGCDAMRDLRAVQAHNAALLDAIPDLLFELDATGRCLDCRLPRNLPAGIDASLFTGRSVWQTLSADAAAICMQAVATALETGHSTGARFAMELAGRETWFELSVARKTPARGESTTVIMMARDITERLAIDAHIARLAYHDALTGLPNRQTFLSRVDREIGRTRVEGGQLAVLFLDLDGFKNVNDTLGHAAGDRLLQWAAERLRESLRPADVIGLMPGRAQPAPAVDADIARLGGDEFTVLVRCIHNPLDAVAVANRIGASMRQPFMLDGRNITLTSSIGIAVWPADGPDAATLLKHADTAMYHAKRSGRDTTRVYSAALTENIVRRMELESAMHKALERDEFFLLYQPQVDVRTGRIMSVEALIRWQHPEFGLIAPLDFIPLAEESGLIERIGAWVLRTAAAAARTWTEAGTPTLVAVNLSPLQVSTPQFAAEILHILKDSGLAPTRLELEVTEGALMENSDRVREALHALRSAGVQLALDDFGTGYSSLAYLTRMPISHIKVDRCFVSGLLVDAEHAAILRAILAMSHSLGLRVTAEGVETAEQVQALVELGCDALQGYWFSRPVPATGIPPLLQQRWDLAPAQVSRSSRAFG